MYSYDTTDDYKATMATLRSFPWYLHHSRILLNVLLSGLDNTLKILARFLGNLRIHARFLGLYTSCTVLQWEVRFVGGFLLGEIVMKTANHFVAKYHSVTDTQLYESFSDNREGLISTREKNRV